MGWRQRLTIARRVGSAARLDQLRGEPLPVILFSVPARQGEAREEFDVQRLVLLRTREKVETLEQQLAALEAALARRAGH